MLPSLVEVRAAQIKAALRARKLAAAFCELGRAVGAKSARVDRNIPASDGFSTVWLRRRSQWHRLGHRFHHNPRICHFEGIHSREICFSSSKTADSSRLKPVGMTSFLSFRNDAQCPIPRFARSGPEL